MTSALSSFVAAYGLLAVFVLVVCGSGFGAWRGIADHQFVSTFELFAFTPAGTPAGILRVRTQGSIDKATDQLSGRATLDFQPTGSPSFFLAGTTTFTGKRIIVVAP